MKIYNSMTKNKEEFIPIQEGNVKMYACGPTVYNYFHIGNARPFLFFDVIRNYFEYKGFSVTYVQNITDIDDKIIDKAIQDNVNYKVITKKYIEAFFEDLEKLGIKRANFNPQATDYMDKVIKLIKRLEVEGYAYNVEGDVYFRVNKSKSYGKLSKKNIDELKVGARIKANNCKENPLDFTLWKKAKINEPSWESPWGKGRPGWHSECVAMSQDLLGDSFDIHGGGTDLIFPHHENEIAQAEVLLDNSMANFWMHVGFLNINGEKMSKSKNNFFTVRDILKKYNQEAVRFFFLSKHYRNPIDFNEQIIIESEKAINNFYDFFSSFENTKILYEKCDSLKYVDDSFMNAMDDDFNTAKVIALMFELLKKGKNINIKENEKIMIAQKIIEIGNVLGFFKNIDFQNKDDDLVEALVKLLIVYRADAKKNKDYKKADQIRDDLLRLDIQLKDSKDKTEWLRNKKY